VARLSFAGTRATPGDAEAFIRAWLN
jgi:hypothetical protein